MLQPRRKRHWVSQFLTRPWEVNTKREPPWSHVQWRRTNGVRLPVRADR